jgi:sialate O-acetylesterase
MIAPLVPYAFRGALWYQGEGNAGSLGHLYGPQLSTLIADWRTRFAQGDFPFAWVQLPNFMAPQKEPVETGGWVVVQEQMLKTLSVPHTGMAITVDIGMEKDIHPVNKQEVGRRLALWALHDVYGRTDQPASGPIPKSHKIEGESILITFDHAHAAANQGTSGLKAFGGGPLKGFAIAGADRKFVWADAVIVNPHTIKVSSPQVKQPLAVRYAWASNPVGNLRNAADLPATPFRTDDWPLEVKAR